MSDFTVDEIEFFSRIDFTEGCWMWVGGKTVDGYGQIVQGGKYRGMAHRYCYSLLKALIPKGRVIDHLCRTPSCVNPSHLEPVTQRENIIRGVNQVARHVNATECHRGHSFTESNTYIYAKRPGTRNCRKCRHEASHKSESNRRKS